MSDDEGDVVVMRVCAAIGCTEIHGLVFDERAGESYCERCYAKLQQAEKQNDYSILLTADDFKAIDMIFSHFDVHRQGYWTFEEFNDYLSATSGNRNDQPDAFESNGEMAAYISAEYGVECATVEVPAAVIGLPEEGMIGLGNVVTSETLQQIYGGYVFHGVNALKDDLNALEDGGEMNFAALE